MMETLNMDNKAGESVTSHSALEVSISFGRFEKDSLSWEKWSTFSQNKYLEEVEKCKTPGSVAQKKAYFEAHYKKIAARKLLEQENVMTSDSSRSDETQDNTMRSDSSRSDETICIDHVTSSSGADGEYGVISYVEEVEQDINSLSAVSSSLLDERKEEDVNAVGSQNMGTESAEDIMNGSVASHEVNYKEADLVAEGTFDRPQEGHSTAEQPLIDNEMVKAKEIKEEISELDALNKSQKTQETKKQQNIAGRAKKKPVSSKTRQPEVSTPRNPRFSKPTLTSTPNMSKPKSVSTPRLSKPTSPSTPRLSKPTSAFTPRMSKPTSASTLRFSKPTSASTPRMSKSTSASTPRLSKLISTPTVMPACRSSTTKPNVSSLRRSKNSSLPEFQRSSPSSLHMSFSLGPANFASVSLNTTRKSLIMEQMGDKDIVKRAFKTFQNNSNQLPTEEKSRGSKQISARESDNRVSKPMIYQKENERTRKATEKVNDQRSQLGARWNTTSSRSLNETRVEKNVIAASSYVGFKNDGRAEKGKEEKSYAREEEKTRLSLKAKDKKDGKIKSLRQTLNFKAKPIPGKA